MKWIIGRFWNNLRSKLLRRFDILISWMWWSLKQTLFSSWLWRLFKGVDEIGCCSSFGVFNPMLDMGLGDLKLTHAKTNKIPMKISTMRNKAWTPMAWNGNIQNIKKNSSNQCSVAIWDFTQVLIVSIRVETSSTTILSCPIWSWSNLWFARSRSRSLEATTRASSPLWTSFWSSSICFLYWTLNSSK